MFHRTLYIFNIIIYMNISFFLDQWFSNFLIVQITNFVKNTEADSLNMQVKETHTNRHLYHTIT